MGRRCISWRLCRGLIGTMLVLGGHVLAGQDDAFPSRPIKLIVGYAAGGSVDSIARTIAPELARRLGQPVQVENMAGASGSIAAVTVALSEPDGHVLLLGSPAEVGINHLLERKARFDPLKDLTPIGLVGSQPLVLVASPATAVRDIDGFFEYAARSRGTARYASAGYGTPLHLAGETIKQRAGIPLEHVPYRGAGPMLPDLLDGKMEFAIMVWSSAMPHVRAGKLRALGLTQPGRSEAARGVPALGEHPRLRGLDIGVWFALLGPGKLPPPVAGRLRDALRLVLAQPQIRRKLEADGVSLMDEVDLAPFLVGEQQKFGRAIELGRLRH